MKKIVTALALVTVMALSGCCTNVEFLNQIRDDLVEDVRPKYEEALRATDRPDDLVANDLALVDDMVASIDMVIGASADEEPEEVPGE